MSKLILKNSYVISTIKSIVIEINDIKNIIDEIKNIYDISIDLKANVPCIKELYISLNKLDPIIVRDCGIKSLSFEDLGPSKEYYPNHGRYINKTLILNERLLDDTKIIQDDVYKVSLNKFEQTLYHELGHGWDENKGRGTGCDLSLHDEWLKLSGWTKEPKPGYKRIRIREKGTPELIGEYYYSPEAKFTRFYAKRNPWDDWADSFSYYVGGAKSFLPENKIKYFDNILKVGE